MKTSHASALAATTLIVGFLAARWCTAQSPDLTPKPPTSYDFGAMQQLGSFVSYLQDTKQTNALRQFNDYSNASLASRDYADLGVTLAVLQRLGDGRTNEAYTLLEGNLEADIVALAASYRELPASLRSQTNLKTLGLAKDYLAKHPSQHPSQVEDDTVANAFKILDNK